MKHIVKPLQQLQSIYQKIHKPLLKNKVIKSIRLELIKLFKDPIIQQEITLFDTRNIISKDNQKFFSSNLFYEYDFYGENIQRKTESLPIKYSYEIGFSYNVNDIQDEVYIKLQKAHQLSMSFLMSSLLSTTSSTNELISAEQEKFILTEFEQLATSFLKAFPNFIAWRKENEACFSRSTISNFIMQLAYDASKEPNDEESNHQIIMIQTICSYFIDQLTATNELASIKITKIRYVYIAKQYNKRASFKLYFNEVYITFTGDIATILKIIFDNPYDEIDMDEFDLDNSIKVEASDKISGTDAYDRYYRKIEKVNLRIYTDKSLICFRILDLLHFSKSSVSITSQYRKLIQIF